MGDGNCKLITISRSGTVSLLDGLTKETASLLAKELLFDPFRGMPQDGKTRMVNYTPRDGDIVQTRIIE